MHYFFILIVLFFATSLANAEKISLDEVFVINLDRSKERYENTNKLLNSEGIKHKRLSATDGYEMKIKDLLSKKEFIGRDVKEKKVQFECNKDYKVSCTDKFSIKYEPKLDRKGVCSSKLSAGELGCMCSHVRIYKEIVDKNLKNVLIFEDDIQKYNSKQDVMNFKDSKVSVGKNDIWRKMRLWLWNLVSPKYESKFDLSKGFQENLNLVLNNTLPGCDVIFLYYFYLPPKISTSIFTNPLETIRSIKNAHQEGNYNSYMKKLEFVNNRDFGSLVSYIMTKSGAEKMLKEIDNQKGYAIDAYFMRLALDKKITLCGVHNNIISPNYAQSDINERS